MLIKADIANCYCKLPLLLNFTTLPTGRQARHQEHNLSVTSENPLKIQNIFTAETQRMSLAKTLSTQRTPSNIGFNCICLS
jgi:hypothetical protein